MYYIKAYVYTNGIAHDMDVPQLPIHERLVIRICKRIPYIRTYVRAANNSKPRLKTRKS